MDFGIFLDFVLRRGCTQEETFKEAFDLVDLAEASGLDTVWLGEMHFNPNRSVLSAPIIVACSIATRTKRLRVGMAVQVLPLIHPLRIAEEAATVDQISQGRFEFGVGRSGNMRAYDAMGIDYDESRERFQEALDIIRCHPYPTRNPIRKSVSPRPPRTALAALAGSVFPSSCRCVAWTSKSWRRA